MISRLRAQRFLMRLTWKKFLPYRKERTAQKYSIPCQHDWFDKSVLCLGLVPLKTATHEQSYLQKIFGTVAMATQLEVSRATAKPILLQITGNCHFQRNSRFKYFERLVGPHQVGLTVTN